MDNDTSNAKNSDHEMRVLVKTPTNSAEYIHKKHIILTFIAAFLIGFGVAAVIINLVNMNEKKYLSAEMFLKKTDETMQELQKIGTMLNTLTVKTDPPVEKPLTDSKSSITPQSEKTAVQTMQSDMSLERIKVYIHYPREKDGKAAEGLSDFLKSKGYLFVNTEMVHHRSREIRYFHDEDKDVALLLQRHLSDFIAGSHGKRIFTLNIKNCGRYYPSASKGSLEVWVFF
jgi:hypothetical protein